VTEGDDHVIPILASKQGVYPSAAKRSRNRPYTCVESAARWPRKITGGGVSAAGASQTAHLQKTEEMVFARRSGHQPSIRRAAG